MAVVELLDIKGMARELALNCALQELSGQTAVLAVDPTHARLLNEARRRQIEQALGRPFRAPVQPENTAGGGVPRRNAGAPAGA